MNPSTDVMHRYSPFLLLLLLAATALPLSAGARNEAERTCLQQASDLYYADRARLQAEYYADISDNYRIYAEGLENAAFIANDDERDDRQDQLRDEWYDRRREARDRYNDARGDAYDVHRERQRACRGIPDDDDDFPSSRSSSSRSRFSSSSSMTGGGFCGDGRCTDQESMVMCPACAYGTPPEQCRCRRVCEQDCGRYGYDYSYGYSSSRSSQWNYYDAQCGNGRCEHGENNYCPCDAVDPQYRHLCAAPCQAGSCQQDC